MIWRKYGSNLASKRYSEEKRMKFLVKTLLLIVLMYLTFFTFGVQGSEVIEDDAKAAKNTTKAGTAVSFPQFFIILITLCKFAFCHCSFFTWNYLWCSKTLIFSYFLFTDLDLQFQLQLASTDNGSNETLIIGVVIAIIVILVLIVCICSCFKCGRECLKCIVDCLFVCAICSDDGDDSFELS